MSGKGNNDKLDRRNFLHSAAMAAAGLGIAPKLFAQDQTGNKADDINVALIGAGNQGQVLVNACEKIPGLRFKAVCDIWESYSRMRVCRFLKAYGHQVNAYRDYDEMLDKEKDLDAVIVATPDCWHKRHTVACFKAGLHVYCEKGMATRIEDAREMVRASEKASKLLQIGCQRRSNPRYIHCYDKLIKQARLLGRISVATGQWNRREMGPLGWPEKYKIDKATLERYGYESMEQLRNWQWYRGLGCGPIAERGTHQIDVFNWFLGARPKSVQAIGGVNCLDKKTHEWYDTVMVIYEYETKHGPVCAHYQIVSNNSSDWYFEKFMGDKGTMAISEISRKSYLYPERLSSDKSKWARCIKDGSLVGPDEIADRLDSLTVEQLSKMLIVDETPPALKEISLKLPIKITKAFHQFHLENFFDAIRGKVQLNCPGRVGLETAVAVLKVNEAIETGRKIDLKDEDFEA